LGKHKKNGKFSEEETQILRIKTAGKIVRTVITVLMDYMFHVRENCMHHIYRVSQE